MKKPQLVILLTTIALFVIGIAYFVYQSLSVVPTDFPDAFTIANPLLGRYNQLEVGYEWSEESGLDGAVESILLEDIDWLFGLDSASFSNRIDLSRGRSKIDGMNVVGTLEYGLILFSTTRKKKEYFTLRAMLEEPLPPLEENYSYKAVLVFSDNDSFMPLGEFILREEDLVNGFRLKPKFMTEAAKFAIMKVSDEDQEYIRAVYEVDL